MDDILLEIRRLSRMIWRHRWIGLLVGWSVGALGVLMVFVQQDVYEATARVYVDTTSQLRLLLDDQIVETDVEDQLRFVRQALLGTPLLLRVARETGLIDGADTQDQQLAAITTLSARIQIVSSAELNPSPWNARRVDDTYLIRYQHNDRETAIAVVSKLLDIFVEDTLGAKRSSSRTAGQFLKSQLSEYESRLQAAEAALAQFNRENYDRLPSLQGGYFQSMQIAREELDQARQEFELAESRLNSIESQLRGESPRVTASGELDPNSLEARILDTERRLQDLKLRYTDQHPDVSALVETLEILRDQWDRREAAGGDRLGSISNPVFQALQISRNEAESEVQALRAVVVQRQKRVSELQGLINEMPEVEAELARLNRDYDVVHSRYQSLLDSLEREKLSREVLEAEEVEFRVIDPPRADFDPVAPQRELLLLALLVFSTGAGVAVAYGIGQLRPVIDSASSLEQFSGLSVIGTIGLQSTHGDDVLLRDSTALFVAGAGLLIVVLLAMTLLEIVGPGLRGLF